MDVKVAGKSTETDRYQNRNERENLKDGGSDNE